MLLWVTAINKMSKLHVQFLNKNFPFFQNNDSKNILKKWSMDSGIHVSCWSFNLAFHPLKVKDLTTLVLKLAPRSDLPEFMEEDLIIEPVPCTITSMEFFDRLLDPANGVVNRSGDGGIRGCFEQTVDNFIVADELRQMLLNEESEVYPLFTQIERTEFLFRLFLHFALGGQYCQYEDEIQPYIDATISAYKTLLSVQKDADTGDVRIRSKCFRVLTQNIQNFIYIIIDPGLREATLFTHKI